MTHCRRPTHRESPSPVRRRGRACHSLLPLAVLLGCVAGSPELRAQDEERCVPAERFLVEDRAMEARIDPDTVDDWRTQQLLPGCRVTAAGLTDLDMNAEAQRFYDRLRAAGWVRTPDPRDAPGESSLRFRWEETDCLFNFYEGLLLFTEAELEVSTIMAAGAGQARYNVLVQCKPALDAAPRGG
jgi:hypothetical protein